MSSEYTVTAVDRAVNVFECLARNSQGLSLAELSEETEIPKSTLFRIMLTLADRNCVVQDDQKTYQLGLKLWELGSAFLGQSDLQEDASTHMQHLADVCEESVFLSVLDGEEVVYVRRMESPKSAVVVRKLGQRAPIYCTATGLAMLAFLPEAEINRTLDSIDLESINESTTTDRTELRRKLESIRENRVAVVDGEYNPALLCVSSPILDEEGRPIAAFTAALLSAQTSEERVETVKSQVSEAAEELSRKRGYLGDYSPVDSSLATR
ncbi:MAG: IclR family transcriptional regulator [Salinibacter sp.]